MSMSLHVALRAGARPSQTVGFGTGEDAAAADIRMDALGKTPCHCGRVGCCMCTAVVQHVELGDHRSLALSTALRCISLLEGQLLDGEQSLDYQRQANRQSSNVALLFNQVLGLMRAVGQEGQHKVVFRAVKQLVATFSLEDQMQLLTSRARQLYKRGILGQVKKTQAEKFELV